MNLICRVVKGLNHGVDLSLVKGVNYGFDLLCS